MEELREIRQQRWREAKAKAPAAAAAAPSSSSAAGSSWTPPAAPSPSIPRAAPSAPAPKSPPRAAEPKSPPAPNSAPTTLQRLIKVHILPLGSFDRRSGSVFQAVSPLLKTIRDKREKMWKGKIFQGNAGQDFIVVDCEPKDGFLSSDTDYFFEGEPVVRFEKIQFLGIKNAELADVESNVLFQEYVGPYFQSQSANPDEARLDVMYSGSRVKIMDLDFEVAATEPHQMGIVGTNTLIFVDWDQTPEFERIHVVPFQDTLPRVYEFDLFNDYLKPYFKQNTQMKYKVNDQFVYHGVQFKVVCCEPDGPARIGRNTSIHCEGVLHPSLRNLLPPELLAQLSYLPPGLQMLLLNTDALGSETVYERLMEVQETLTQGRGLREDQISALPSFTWTPTVEAQESHLQCMICLDDFKDGEEARRLPCNHVFHACCPGGGGGIDEWLRRCTECPICKGPVVDQPNGRRGDH